ncbi:histidine phosphatase family protein [Pseudonocardia xishanensis]|uniref:Histidine phosphatase family protein n=1 Tax=Pseudonocardia xishanensis TaxID=630995 RepID=A0ABP8RSV1_9PSEU
MRLILVRHGLPEKVHGDIRADPGLTDVGLRQAERVVDALAADAVDAIYASTMARARQTAEPLARDRGLDVGAVADLCEFDSDQASYLPTELLAAERPDEWARMVAGDLPSYVDAPAFTGRVVAAMETIVGVHSGRDTVAVFAHAGVINAYLAHVLGIGRALPFPLDYAGITRVVARRDGVRKPRTVNEIAHLADLLGT